MHEQIVSDLLESEGQHQESHLSRDFLQAAVDLTSRYAKVEKLAFGDVNVQYSPVSLEVDLQLPGDVVKQAEELARLERARLELGPGPVLEMSNLVEEYGIKVIPRVFPEDSKALGGFFFSEKLGPAILVNVRGSQSEMDYTLARHLGNFLADYDPYITTISFRPDPSDFTNAVDVRAHCFALAFLMPREDLETYRKGMSQTEIDVEFIQQLQVYFEIDPEMILWRFLTLQWIDAEKLQALLQSHPELSQVLRSPPSTHSGEDEVLPDRFIQMVAYAYGKKKLKFEEAAKLFKTNVQEAQRILDQFDYEKLEEKPAAKSQ